MMQKNCIDLGLYTGPEVEVITINPYCLIALSGNIAGGIPGAEDGDEIFGDNE